jgi:hypothetical protein
MDTDHSVQRRHGSLGLVSGFVYSLIARVAVFTLLLAVLAGVVWTIPVLWELAVAGLIGAVYWIFFRLPPSED